MREIGRYILKISFLFVIIFSTNAEGKVLSIGNPDAKVVVKVFSSLTCPHCANFHNSVFNKLKEEYIDKGLVKFEHHAFPLDLAALNAEVIVRCAPNNEKKFKLREKESIFVKLGQKHRIENKTKNPLEIVEVQIGKVLDESDIVRLDDIYGRK